MAEILPVGFQDPPHNIEAEGKLLGSILYDNQRYHQVSNVLSREHFFDAAHARIYAKIEEAIDLGHSVDESLLEATFRDDPGLVEAKGSAYLSQIVEAGYLALNVIDYANEIRKHAIRRQTIRALDQARARANDPATPESPHEQLDLIERDIEFIREQGKLKAEPYQIMDMAYVEECPTPERKWFIEGCIPAGYLTLLAGDSGLGKSLLAQQMANHIAIGRDFLGNSVLSRKVMMIATEDSADELIIRQKHIFAHLSISHEDLNSNFLLLPRLGCDNYLVGFDRDIGHTTANYHRLRRLIEQHRPDLLIADNILQLMAGDASSAQHATYFCNQFLAFQKAYGCTTMLVGHVPKNNADAGYFGSIAWKASIRSHLVLKKHDSDKDVRKLIVPKANYGESDDDGVELKWERGVLKTTEDELLSYGERLDKQMREGELEQVFLDALDKLTEMELPVSHARTPAKNYAPDVIVARKMNGNASHREIEQAMNRLENKDAIRRQRELPWRRPGNRHPAVGIARTAQ